METTVAFAVIVALFKIILKDIYLVMKQIDEPEFEFEHSNLFFFWNDKYKSFGHIINVVFI